MKLDESDPQRDLPEAEEGKKMPKCAFLGPVHTFSGQFAKKQFPKSELVAADDFVMLLDHVVSSRADFAIAPLENTNCGTVWQFQVGLIERAEALYITDIFSHEIELHLYSEVDLPEITEVRSIAPVFPQARRWLDANLPEATRNREYTSTDAAVISVKDCGTRSSAIGCIEACTHGIPIVAKNIETKPNFTTFCQVERCHRPLKDATRILVVVQNYEDSQEVLIDEALVTCECYYTSTWLVDGVNRSRVYEIASSDPKGFNESLMEAIRQDVPDALFLGCYSGKTLTTVSVSPPKNDFEPL
jgi:prephenate dehydratase